MKMLDMLRAMNAFVGEQDDSAVTCPTCGAVVEDDALDVQTMADGALMWPRPFCRKHLLAGLRRLDAELRLPVTGDGEDGDA